MAYAAAAAAHFVFVSLRVFSLGSLPVKCVYALRSELRYFFGLYNKWPVVFFSSFVKCV